MHLLRRSCRVEGRNGPGGNIRTLLLSLNTLKASVKDSVSAIKNISSTLASLTNSSNTAAATTGKTSYSPRFDPFSGTIDLDSPLRPPRKEHYLGPAVNSATSNLDPPIDTGSKEGFKDTITSSIVKELSKKAYTIPDDKSKKEDVYNEFHALTFSTYRKGLSAFNAEFNGYLAKLTLAKIDIDPSLILNYLNIEYLMADILEESRNPATEVCRAAHVANSSNSTPNSNFNPSKKGKNKKKGKKKASYNVKGQNYSAKSAEQASFVLGSYNLAIEEEEEFDSSSNSMEIPSNSIRKKDYRPIIEDAIVSEAIEPNKRYKLRNSPAKGTTLEGIGPSLRGKRPCRPIKPLATAQAPYQSPCKTREPKPLTGTRDLPYILRELVIEGNNVEKAISSPTLKEPNIGQRDYYNLLNLAKLWHVRLGHIGLRLLKKTSSITKGLPNFDKIKEADFHCSSYDRGKAVRRVSKALIPDLSRVLDSIEGNTVKIRPRLYNRNPIVLLLVNRKSRYRWVFNLPNKSGPIVANAIKGFFRGLRNGFGRYPTKFHFDGGTEITDLLTTVGVCRVWIPRFYRSNTSATLSNNYLRGGRTGPIVTCPSPDRTDPANPNPTDPNPAAPSPLGAVNKAPERSGHSFLTYLTTAAATTTTTTTTSAANPATTITATGSSDISFDSPFKGLSSNLDLDLEGAVSPDPSNLNTEKPISIEIGPSKLEHYESSSDKPIFVPKPIEVIAPNQPITNEPLDNSNLISEGDKIQLDYYKLLAKTSSYILSFVYEARKRVISKDSTPTTYKQVLKLPRDERSKWLEAITKEFIQLLELGVFKFLPRSLLPSNRKLITCRNVLKVQKDAKNRPIKYKSRIPPTWRILLAIDLGVFYNTKTYYFIVTYVDDCLFIGPNIGYITDLKKRLNKVYAIEDLGPAAYFLGWLSRSLNRPIKSHLNAAKNLFKYLNSTKDYSICFSYNGNIVADLGPKLSNSSNTTTKLSRDFYSKEGPRPLTTTSTTIVDSRNSKGSSRTSIINSSLVPIGFSDSDFTRDKATSKSTYGYLYKLAALYARTKHTLLKFQYVKEQVKAKIVTIIYLNTKFNSTGYFTAL
ncbi:hypothetical protein P8C59_009558 [Phyllachora maydis]|uniref:Reverse transcriptase Ty1/copia-type domain-containing protein n=1 Tax=Phyllachora maydis TaxID=1825666 RepID=A0AAD9IE53_9PEZI|nr:hypothetical protein P8C59_009558 [Phyllachora maydis]